MKKILPSTLPLFLFLLFALPTYADSATPTSTATASPTVPASTLTPTASPTPSPAPIVTTKPAAIAPARITKTPTPSPTPQPSVSSLTVENLPADSYPLPHFSFALGAQNSTAMSASQQHSAAFIFIILALVALLFAWLYKKQKIRFIRK